MWAPPRSRPEETHGIPHHGVDILEPDADLQRGGFHCAWRASLEQEIAGRGHLPHPGGRHRFICTELSVRCALYRRKSTGRSAGAAGRRAGPEGRCRSSMPSCSRWTRKRLLPSTPTIRCGCCGRWNTTAPPAKSSASRRRHSLPPERPYRSLVLGAGFPGPGGAVPPHRPAGGQNAGSRAAGRGRAGLAQPRSRFRTAAQAIGYKEFFPYFERTASLEACADKLKQASRNYAKRQLTWFRHMDGVVWLDAGAPEVQQRACRTVQEFLSKG